MALIRSFRAASEPAFAAFEIRYQLRNPVFWVSVAIFFLLGFGLASSDAVSFGSPGAVHENSPYTLTIAMALFATFYLFVITSFVANAVVRDDVTGFGPMIRATPVGRSQFLAGRFLGGLAIAILGYAAVPLGIALGAAVFTSVPVWSGVCKEMVWCSE